VGQLGLAAGFAWIVPDLTWLYNPTASATTGVNVTFRRGIALVALTGAVLIQAFALMNAWRARPVEQLRLYKATTTWLRTHTLPGEVVGAHNVGILGYLADRATLALPLNKADKGTRALGARTLLTALDQARPDYCLALPGVAWDGVRAQPWFQERYHPIHQESIPYTSTSPWMLFRYTPSPFDRGERRSVWRAFFETEHAALQNPSISPGSSSTQASYADTDAPIELLDYRLSHRRITPGEPVYLTLYWSPALLKAPRLSASKITQMHIRLTAPDTQQVWAAVESTLPYDLAREFWKLALQEDAEVTAVGVPLIGRHIVWPPEEIPEGEYNLEIALRYQSGRPLFVRAMGTQASETVARDYVALTTLYHPSDISLVPFTPDHILDVTLNADSDRHPTIALEGYDAPERIAPGDLLRVALYWHAMPHAASSPAEDTSLGDYKVFIHILSPPGDVIAQEDSKPVYWFYPTNTWQPGEYIRDEHVLALSPDIPRGNYQIMVGMYDPQSGERLEVRDAQGNRLSERRIMLQTLRVR